MTFGCLLSRAQPSATTLLFSPEQHNECQDTSHQRSAGIGDHARRQGPVVDHDGGEHPAL